MLNIRKSESGGNVQNWVGSLIAPKLDVPVNPLMD